MINSITGGIGHVCVKSFQDIRTTAVMSQVQLQYSFAECWKPACLQSELHVMGICAKQLGLNEKKNVCLHVDMCVFAHQV